MSTVPFVFTMTDVLDALSDFAQGVGVGMAQPTLRRAVRLAYRQVMAERDWTFMHANGRVPLQKAQTLTGEYDHTGGTYERQLTATSAFPTDIEDWAARIGDVVCDVESLKSNTDPYVVTLNATMNPREDVASGEVRVYPRWYALPPDFMSLDRPITDFNRQWHVAEIPLADMLRIDRRHDETGTPSLYAIGPVQDLYGQQGLYLHPASDQTETLDFLYLKRLRDLKLTGLDAKDYAGTVTIASGSAAVTGTNTQFSAAMLGAIIRLGDASNIPGGLESTTPYVEQRSIVAFTAASGVAAITLDQAVTTTYTTVKYRIADPVDVAVAAYDAVVALTKKDLAIDRGLKNVPVLTDLAREALADAKAADGRVTGREVAGPGAGDDGAFAGPPSSLIPGGAPGARYPVVE